MDERTRSTTTAAITLLFGTVTFTPDYPQPGTFSRRAGCLRHRFSPAPVVEDVVEIEFGRYCH